MANYTYKSSYGVVPAWFEDNWCADMGITSDELMDGDPVDWHQWELLVDYIAHLEAELAGGSR